MSTITAILEPDVDGVLHLPLPEAMHSSKVKVTATLESLEGITRRPTRVEVIKALQSLARLGTFKKITDPVAWQREIRKDRPLLDR